MANTTAIDQAILDRINTLTGTDFNLVAEADQLLASLKQMPGFRSWAETEAASKWVQMLMKQALSNGRRNASAAARRRGLRSNMAKVQTIAKKGKAAGKTTTQIKEEIATAIMNGEWCVDDQNSEYKPFRRMTSEDLIAAAESREKKGRTMLMDAAFCRIIAKSLRPGEVVEDRFDEKAVAKAYASLSTKKFGLPL
jgi:urease accessory protein UreF